jgi:uncharacterized protein
VHHIRAKVDSFTQYAEKTHWGKSVSQTAALYHLQTLDSQRDAVQTRLAEIEILLSQNEAVRAVQAAVDAASNYFNQWRTRTTDLELERSQLNDEAAAAEERLYSGSVRNPRELSDLQDKITSLRHRRELLEEPLLEAMMETEQGESDVSNAQAKMQHVLEEQAQTLGALTTEQNALRDKLEKLDFEIEQSRRGIQTANLALYDKLRARPNGVAVAKLDGAGECSSCGVQVTSREAQQVKHGEVLPCPTCGRILFS